MAVQHRLTQIAKWQFPQLAHRTLDRELAGANLFQQQPQRSLVHRRLFRHGNIEAAHPITLQIQGDMAETAFA